MTSAVLLFVDVLVFRYSNIFVTAPSPDNLKTLFEFVFRGFDVLGYQVSYILFVFCNIFVKNGKYEFYGAVVFYCVYCC